MYASPRSDEMNMNKADVSFVHVVSTQCLTPVQKVYSSRITVTCFRGFFFIDRALVKRFRLSQGIESLNIEMPALPKLPLNGSIGDGD